MANSPFVMLSRCEDLCNEGTHGFMCQELCHCQHGGMCSPHNGSCICTLGWMVSASLKVILIENALNSGNLLALVVNKDICCHFVLIVFFCSF